MKKIIFILLIIAAFTACQSNNGRFVIKNKQVGNLTDSTTVAQMKQLYQNDSIVKKSHQQTAFAPYDEYTIYDKSNKEILLVVTPVKINDEQSIIKQVEIKSPRFKTEKGVNLNSKFVDFKKHHKIGHIDETFKHIVIFIDDLNATIDMNKDVLPLNARNDRTIKIDETLIPDNAKINHFVVFLND